METNLATGKTRSFGYDQPQWGKPTKVQMWDYGVPVSGTASKEIHYTYGYTVNSAQFRRRSLLRIRLGRQLLKSSMSTMVTTT